MRAFNAFTSDDTKMERSSSIKRFDEDYALEQKACAAFSQLQKLSLSNDKVLCPGKICGTNIGHRVSILGKNGDFYIKNDFNYKKIRVFSEEIRRQVFPSETNIKDSFISFEGSNQDIHHFLSQELKFCLRPATEYEFIIDAYQVDLDRQPQEEHIDMFTGSSNNGSAPVSFVAALPLEGKPIEKLVVATALSEAQKEEKRMKENLPIFGKQKSHEAQTKPAPATTTTDDDLQLNNEAVKPRRPEEVKEEVEAGKKASIKLDQSSGVPSSSSSSLPITKKTESANKKIIGN